MGSKIAQTKAVIYSFAKAFSPYTGPLIFLQRYPACFRKAVLNRICSIITYLRLGCASGVRSCLRVAAFNFILATLLLSVCLVGGSVHAQSIAPLRIEPDPSGLEVLGGKVETGGPVLSIPAAPRLTYTRGSDWWRIVEGESRDIVPDPQPNGTYAVQYGASQSVAFECFYGSCRNALAEQINSGSFNFDENTLVMTEGVSGDRYVFGVRQYDNRAPNAELGTWTRGIGYFVSEIRLRTH